MKKHLRPLVTHLLVFAAGVVLGQTIGPCYVADDGPQEARETDLDEPPVLDGSSSG